MVDYWPYGGNYTGVTVTGNTFNSEASMIRMGYASDSFARGAPRKLTPSPPSQRRRRHSELGQRQHDVGP